MTTNRLSLVPKEEQSILTGHVTYYDFFFTYENASTTDLDAFTVYCQINKTCLMAFFAFIKEEIDYLKLDDVSKQSIANNSNL